MLRLVLMIFLLWVCADMMGQSVAIPKAEDIVVIRGKSYYLHTVQPGQTLFSICKAYGVNLEEVKELNDKKDNNLSLYEVLRIPYTEPFVEQDGKYYYHKVAKGETLYSIARFYNIRPKRLLKFNDNYSHNESLAVGAVVRLPLNEIDRSVLQRQPEKSEIVNVPVAETKKDKQTEEVVSEDILLAGTRGNQQEKPTVKDTLLLDARETVVESEGKEMPAYISEVVMPVNPFVKVALLLPFSAKEYPYFLDSLGGHQSVTISSRSEQFLGFYEGILLAVDSLKNRGFKVDLHVFDTERSSEKIYEIVKSVNDLRPDLIIGPVYGSVYKVMADESDNKGIPMVYPLSSRSESFGEYANFIQVNASFGVMAQSMLNWLKGQRAHANIVHIGLNDTEDADWAEKKVFKEQLKQLEGVRSFKWNMDQLPLDSLRTLLLPDRENILVLPVTKEADVSKILPFLSALTDGYQITVLGLPEWQTFTSVDHETYYKLNTKLFTYSYVDYASPAALALADKYRKYFYTEPGSLVFKAFDMGLYFIELAARYRDRSLEAIEYYEQPAAFSKFRFQKMFNGVGKENHGFYIVNYGSDYHLKIEH